VEEQPEDKDDREKDYDAGEEGWFYLALTFDVADFQ